MFFKKKELFKFRLRRNRKLNRKQRQQMYRQTFTTESGHEVLLDLMDAARIVGMDLCVGSPEQTAFNQGQRSVVLSILATVYGDDVVELLGEQLASEAGHFFKVEETND